MLNDQACTQLDIKAFLNLDFYFFGLEIFKPIPERHSAKIQRNARSNESYHATFITDVFESPNMRTFHVCIEKTVDVDCLAR
jgi:hypothetical protein